MMHLLHSFIYTPLLTFLLASRAQAQSLPTTLPGNWTSVGCFTDISTSRTLAAQSFTGDNMTIESCIGFCGDAGYIYAGVEFAHCDSTIQFPSVSAPLDNCNFGCSGDPTQVCGGPNRLNVFYSGDPLPVLVQSIQPSTGGQWSYQGCFTDSTEQRTLIVPVNIPGGVTPQSCVAACRSLGNYTLAGVETGRECWCDNTQGTATQRVSDADCRMVCDADHGVYCGNLDRLALYKFSPMGDGEGPTTPECASTAVGNFTLRAVYKNPPSDGPASVTLKVIVVELVRSLTWTLLSACPNCCSEWPTFSMFNSVVSPKSIVDPVLSMTNIATRDGESLTFVASSPPFPGSQSFCTMADPSVVPPDPSSPSLLAFDGKQDAFSLCKNNTANGRLDVVFSPVTGHPHYLLSDCSSISIQVVV